MTDTSLQDRFAARMGQLLGPEFPAQIGLAVSGGGDSMAMLTLAHNWTRDWGVRLRVVTVDHGLRPESAAEVEMVARECAALGWPHDTLRWHGWDGQGNLQDAARRARLALIDAWRGEMAHILFAHTLDDQAETVLMRLKRGSGVDGLSGMAETRRLSSGMVVLRPLLRERREDLRHYLTTLKGHWVEDPSNADPRFDRVRTRQVLALLSDYGLTPEGLVETASRMARARTALMRRTGEAAARIVTEGAVDGRPTGDLWIARDGFAALDRETQLRLLAAGLGWIASASYRPRATALEAVLDRALAGGGGTLGGCELRVSKTHLHLFREFKAVATLSTPAVSGALWDTRWRLAASYPGLTLRALGPDGWGQLGETAKTGACFAAARSLPALFDDAGLVSCPVLGHGNPAEVAFGPVGGPFAAGFIPH
ncbi:tRNA lysidine(34) synthetase TilS [Roseicyclus elongatus]|uniref:tRNA lysidine(34) synthetase TilS n=1 Tax=Roseicyclus elongatus TaxID=159346 RepID=UPI00046CE8A4|nr:tRNA lysidine(34) synthetase TilS [Roseibacterium elongatum]